MPISNFPNTLLKNLDPLESDQFQLRIFESFADPLAVYDRNYQVLKVNQPLLKFYQRSAEATVRQALLPGLSWPQLRLRGLPCAKGLRTGKAAKAGNADFFAGRQPTLFRSPCLSGERCQGSHRPGYGARPGYFLSERVWNYSSKLRKKNIAPSWNWPGRAFSSWTPRRD